MIDAPWTRGCGVDLAAQPLRTVCPRRALKRRSARRRQESVLRNPGMRGHDRHGPVMREPPLSMCPVVVGHTRPGRHSALASALSLVITP